MKVMVIVQFIELLNDTMHYSISVFIPTCNEFIGSGAFVGCSNLTINCKIASAPSSWSSSLKDSSTTVYWSM